MKNSIISNQKLTVRKNVIVKFDNLAETDCLNQKMITTGIITTGFITTGEATL